jgi:hypothetical protein
MAKVRKKKSRNSPRSTSRQKTCQPADNSLARLAVQLQARQPATALDDLPFLSHLPKRVREKAVEQILDRLDAAIYERNLDVNEDLYGAILMALMPADFEVPDSPNEPTDTPPGPGGTGGRDADGKRLHHGAGQIKSARVKIYIDRCRDGVHLYHAGDAGGDQDRRGLAPAWSGQADPLVAGWQDELPPTAPDPDAATLGFSIEDAY